jgi:flagellar basal body-associated protein FliL
MIGIGLGIGVFVLVLAMAMMFSFGEALPHASTAEPSPVMVELETLTMQAEIIMNAIENDFRSRQLIHEAEGARQMRVAIKAHLENLGGGAQ